MTTRPVDSPEEREIVLKWLAERIQAAAQEADAARNIVGLVENPDSVEQALRDWRKALVKIEALEQTFTDLTGEFPSMVAVSRYVSVVI